MITTVFDCVSKDVDSNDSEMNTIGLMSEYGKGNGLRERVNMVIASSDQETDEFFEQGCQYIVSVVKVVAGGENFGRGSHAVTEDSED